MTVYQRVPVHIYLFDAHGDVLVANESAVRHHQGTGAAAFIPCTIGEPAAKHLQMTPTAGLNATACMDIKRALL